MDKSTVGKLRSSLNSISDDLAELFRGIEVKVAVKPRGIVVLAPNYYWGEPSPAQRNRQLVLKRRYSQWVELLRISLRNCPKQTSTKLDNAERDFKVWLELDGSFNWHVSPNREQNEQSFRKHLLQFEELLAIMDADPGAGVIVVPDTNSIVAEPDPVKYRSLLGVDEFVFMLLPTVLSELDRLKNLHANPDFREKAKKVITRIKGWRQQGSLASGVTVDGTITVMAIASEPDMKATLSWLDQNTFDDRIIASILELQAANPTSRVVLATGDINLLNKADAAMIEHIEA